MTMSMMDIKKVFDQTVRDIKREVNKKVLKVPELEQKTLDATSNEPWGPHGQLMTEIAQATRRHGDNQMVMSILWKRIQDDGRNWRHVYKALTVMEFLVSNGSEKCIDELRDNKRQIERLTDFQYIEPGGKDQGINVRKKAETLVALLSDMNKIRDARQKAQANKEKYKGISSTSYQSNSYGSNPYNDEEKESGNRYDDSPERFDDKYGDRSNSYGDKYGDKKDSYSEKYGGGRGNESYSNHSDRFGDGFEDKFSSRQGGVSKLDKYDSGNGRSADRFSTGSRGESARSEQRRYGEDEGFSTTREPASGLQSSASPTPEFRSPYNAFEGKPISQVDDDDFDDFDPRGRPPSVPAPPRTFQAAPAPPTVDLFANSSSFHAAPTPTRAVPAPPPPQVDFFSAPAPAPAPAPSFPSLGVVPPPSYQAATSNNLSHASGDFTPFSTVAAANSTVNHQPSFPPPPLPPASASSLAPSGSSPSFAAFPPPQAVSWSGSDSANASHAAAPAQAFDPFANPEALGDAKPTGVTPGMKPQGIDSVDPFGLEASPPKKVESKAFEPKSRLWQDAMSSGLVDLNIGQPEKNPLKSLGIEPEKTTTAAQRALERKQVAEATRNLGVGMGKAMGSGSGMGLAGATGLAPPPPPGVGRGGVGMGMGMGMVAPGMTAPGMGGMYPGVGQGSFGRNVQGGFPF